MAKELTLSRMARVLLIMAVCTTSFDIFLVWHLGFTFRVAQILLALPFGYVLCQMLRRPVVIWPLGFTPLLVWTLFLAVFIPNTDFPLRSIGYWLWLVFNTVLIFVVVQLIDDYRKVLSIVRCYLYSFLLVSAFGIFQFFAPRLGLGAPLIIEWWVKGSVPRVNGFSYEPSYFAAYLIMGWVFGMYLLQHRQTIITRRQLLLIVGTISIALVLSSSRGGLLVMGIWFVQYPLYLVWRLCKGFLNPKMLLSTTSLVVLLGLLGTSISLIGFHKISFLLSGVGLFGQAAHSLNTRTGELRDTLQIFLLSPVIGYSLGGVSSAIGHLRGLEVSSLEMAKHNEGMAIFAEALAASGIIGIIPFGLYIFRIIRAPLALSRRAPDSDLQIVLAGLVYALIFELIILQFNQNILRLYLWMHVALLSAAYAVGNKNCRKALASTFPWPAEPDAPTQKP